MEISSLSCQDNCTAYSQWPLQVSADQKNCNLDLGYALGMNCFDGRTSDLVPGCIGGEMCCTFATFATAGFYESFGVKDV